MTYKESDLTLYAQWILDHMTKENRQWLDTMKKHSQELKADESTLISFYAIIVDKRAGHLTKAVASGKCKAETIPVINRKKHREWIGAEMYKLDKAAC